MNAQVDALRDYVVDPSFRQMALRFNDLVIRANRGEMDEPAELSGSDLTYALMMYDCLDNVFRGSTQLLQFLMGIEQSPIVPMRPSVPSTEQAVRLEAERVPAGRLEESIRNRWYPFGPNPHPDNPIDKQWVKERASEYAKAAIDVLKTQGTLSEERVGELMTAISEDIANQSPQFRDPRLLTQQDQVE